MRSRDAWPSRGAAQRAGLPCGLEVRRHLRREAFRRGWPLHLHVAEQRGEVEQCQTEHGTHAGAAVGRLGSLRDTTTAVHGVHLSRGTSRRWAARAPRSAPAPPRSGTWATAWCAPICCWRQGAALHRKRLGGAAVAARDVRQLEYHLRLLAEQRAILDLEPAGVGGLGARLYGVASEGGMRSLGRPEERSAPASPRIFIASISTIRPSPARMPTI